MKYLLIMLILISCYLNSYSFASPESSSAQMEAKADDAQSADEFKITLSFGVNSNTYPDGQFMVLHYGNIEDLNDCPQNKIRDIKDILTSSEYNIQCHKAKGCRKYDFYYTFNHTEEITVPKSIIEDKNTLSIQLSLVTLDENNRYAYDLTSLQGSYFAAMISVSYEISNGTVKIINIL